MPAGEVFQLISSGGAVAVLVLVLMAITKENGWLVSRREHRAMKASLEDQLERERRRSNRWEGLALKNTDLAEGSTEVMGKVVDLLQGKEVK